MRRLLGEINGHSFYKTDKNEGLIAADDVILIKINSQWNQRGGTNTDLLKSLIDYITRHPQGFKGEIIVADNGQGKIGQGMFGSEGKGGSLEWPESNAKDRSQSTQKVVNSFASNGYKVSGSLWDTITTKRVSEFSAGDDTSGFVVGTGYKSTGIKISYPKWTTPFGTKISFKLGVWDVNSKSYDNKKLKLIVMPVLKSHWQYHVCGAVEAYTGVSSNALTDMSSQKSVETGGMGSLIAETRFPDLTILDMIYIGPKRGPASFYTAAVQKNMIAASTDPFALDFWAVKEVLFPAAAAAGMEEKQHKAMNPESKVPKSFGVWLEISRAEAEKAGLPVCANFNSITINEIH